MSSLRADLITERDALRRQLGEFGVDGSGAMSFDENFADSGQVAAEQGETRALVATLQEKLVEVDHALAKWDAGTYGPCEECGTDISEPRLEAMPATRYCIVHA